MKVLIGPSSFAELDKAPLKALADAGCEVIENPYRRKLTKAELFQLLPGVKGLIAGLEPLDREVLQRSELRVISRCGTGMSNVDLDAAREMGIVVRNTPLAPVEAVAELTIGALLCLIRNICLMDAAMHRGEWKKVIGRQLQDMTAAVIGVGNIGGRLSELLRAFGCGVLGVDPARSDDANGVPIVELDEALAQADVVLLHCSGERCVIGKREFGIMKKGAYLLNAARGGLVDEAALLAALENKTLAGAWIDTFVHEPYGGTLARCPNVILTPHIGSYTAECRSRMEKEAVQNLLGVLK